MNTWRYQAWDIEAQAPCIETIAYSIAKTWFLFHETANDSDPFVRTLLDMTHSDTLSYQQQNTFIEGVHFVELQDIMVQQRLNQFEKIKKLYRRFNGKKITLHNLPRFIDEVAEKVGKYFIPLTELTIDFARISAIIDKKDEKISKQYCGDYPLATIPYIRHTLYMSAILGINECTDEEIGSMYSLLYLSRDESLLIVQRE